MICVAWDGLSAYSVAALESFIAKSNRPVSIVAIEPEVPKTSNDEILGVKINWIKRNCDLSITSIIGCVPSVLIVGGWRDSGFNRFGSEVRKAGGKVIVMVDNQFEWNWKLIPWIIRFNLFIRHKFSGYLVPGKSTARLLQCCGVRKKNIGQSLYTASHDIFTNGEPLENRPKRMLYVGRFISLKNVISMIKAFIEFSKSYPDWELHCYGQGDLEDEMKRIAELHGCNKIIIRKFVQPNELASLYKDARVLVLPSFWDHWGVVVHEATLSGCGLLLSDKVGAGWNLCTKKNGVLFNPKKTNEIAKAMKTIANWDVLKWKGVQAESLQISKTISPEVFTMELQRLINN